MGLSDKDIGRLALLSILHDIGKIAIPQNILLKPGRLDTEEWEIMKTHTSKGYRIAKASPELEAIAELAIKYDAFVVTDEVYEHIVYAPAEHICMASLKTSIPDAGLFRKQLGKGFHH